MLLLRILNRLASWQQQDTGAVNLAGIAWQPQPQMAATVDQILDTPTLDNNQLQWDRPEVPTAAGLLSAKAAHVIAIKPRGEHFAAQDPHARQIYALSRRGVTLPHGRRKGFWGKFLRGRMREVSLTPQQLSGRSLLLGAYYDDCNNYYHFWADVMADLWFAQRAGVEPAQLDHILLPYSGCRWQQQILELCGIDLNKVVPLSAYSHLRCTELILPLRAKGSYRTPVWLNHALRELSHFNPAKSARRRLYIARLDASKRQLSNEAEIISLLQQHHFEIISCSAFNVAEQQQLFSEAAVVIAPHGAALTNLLWCAPGTRILEFVPEGHHNPGFRDLATLGKLDYAVLQSYRADQESTALQLELAPLQQYLAEL
ncbi:MAG: glycosyltransferase family 61 protein [Alishewanella aestuarii]